MLVSAKHSFVFIHIYKTAGTSIRSVFSAYAAAPVDRVIYKARRKIGIPSPYDQRRYGQHWSANQIRDTMGYDTFDDLFSFAFVRNPWDWQVSLYHYMLREERHHQHELAKSFSCFSDYISWRCYQEPRFQADFIFNGNHCLVDYIGKMETIDVDIKQISKRIGVNLPDKFKAPHKNISNDTDYRAFYTDETRDLVAHTFEHDIKTFDYRF